ncbi:MAG TPA: Flp pilus assembly protein CpaB [Povalibacter sp.]
MKGGWITALMMTGALGTGGAAAYFADGYIERTVTAKQAELDSRYEPVRVVVANSDLRPGTFLSGRTVAIREIPRSFLHADAVLADNWTAATGRVLAHAVRSGEPVLLSHLAQDAGAGFSSQLAEGMRALTFPVDDEASISGMLAPGDRIDILFTTLSGNESVTLPLLLDVPVIATGVRTVTNAAYVDEKTAHRQYNTVTVSVTPDNAARITLAQDAGKITVALRQPQDNQPIQIARVTKRTLLNGERLAKVSSPRPRIEIILGGS